MCKLRDETRGQAHIVQRQQLTADARKESTPGKEETPLVMKTEAAGPDQVTGKGETSEEPESLTEQVSTVEQENPVKEETQPDGTKKTLDYLGRASGREIPVKATYTPHILGWVWLNKI
ncbi:hypothetical protein NDU88_000775 [Pleurodeles waltl]|uniref:Uncharacterized protein n=1 Tax=Pleurodeles waltl TaxID=8319 RepID=A0AAV7USR9_PLEWA|nr:hypothetical protein NDU88_000775 [Pleurodeles waltl]